MKHIEVMVSTHYRGKGWTDKSTGVFFEDSLKPRVYRIPLTGDLSSIEEAIRQNLLMVVTGDLEAAIEKEQVEVVEQKEKKVISKVTPKEVDIEKEVAEKETVTTATVEELDLEKLENATLAELKKYAKEEGIEHKAKITRKELQEVIKKAFEG